VSAADVPPPGDETPPEGTLVPEGAPEDAPTFHRTHPLTPLISGWKLLAGLVAVVTAQNLGRLASEFTWRRALLFAGLLVAALLVTMAVSTLRWWRTTYAITADGVVMHAGVLTRTRRTAPRSKIESVSVERPLLARVLGLAKVRIEIAGGADSHLDLDYVTGREAETIRREILEVAASPVGSARRPRPDAVPGEPEPDPDAAPARSSARESVRSFVYDGVTEGHAIAQVPTERLLRSMLRDLGFMLGLLVGLVWVIVTVVVSITTDGIGLGALAALIPALLIVPQMVLRRIENGWGFVSRLTERGLRMRRGLLSTRTDNIGPGRVQDLRLSQPLLWRGPRWIGATATVAGIGAEGGGDGASHVLPVGTVEELHRTLGSLLPPLGTDDDLAVALDLLSRPARELDGLRAGHRLFWIARRTAVAVLLPEVLAVRTGVLTRRLVLVPRERIQGVTLAQGPLARRLGVATVDVAVAVTSVEVSDVPLEAAVALRDTLARDAASGRLYRDRETWPRPPLELPGEEMAA